MAGITTAPSGIGKVVKMVNPDLQKERDAASFNPRDLTDVLFGSSEFTAKKREMEKIIFGDPAFTTDKYNQTQSERYEAGLGKITRLGMLVLENGWTRDLYTHAVISIRFDFPLALHFGMFIPVIERLGTDEQRDKWLMKANSLQIIGTYAQTELGHGTNLRGLETTAVYDSATQEFVVNTPVPSGMKFWPGALGKSANHVVLMAQLYSRGQHHGMQAFMLPIRDIGTHKPLPGIEVGSMGPKIGMHTADNGYLIVKDVRIPRENMLMRYDKVSPDGTFTREGADRANYGTMMMVRATIVFNAYNFISQAATIAVRYAAVRRQSELKPGAPEPQIMDYQTQQHKLFPNIALSYAVFFTQQYMRNYYDHIYETEMSQGIFTSVAELHSQSSGLKAYTTDLSVAAIEVLRRSCGGHGYLMASGLCDLYGDALGSVTYEGENTVMYLQTARYLTKIFIGGEKMTGSSAYLAERLPAQCPIRNEKDCYNLEFLAMAFKKRAYYMISGASKRLQSSQKDMEQYLAWNANSVELVGAAMAHLDSFLAINFMECLRTVKTTPEVLRILTSLSQLHALHRIASNSGEFIESGALTVTQLEMVRDAQVNLYSLIRPDAVALVDAFDWHDGALCSALGRFDGNVYEALYETAKQGPMNTTQVHPSFYKYLKPLQEMSKLPDAVALVDAFDWHDGSLCSALGRFDGNVYEALYETAKQGPMNKTQVHPSFYKYLKPLQEMSKL